MSTIFKDVDFLQLCYKFNAISIKISAFYRQSPAYSNLYENGKELEKPK